MQDLHATAIAQKERIPAGPACTISMAKHSLRKPSVFQLELYRRRITYVHRSVNYLVLTSLQKHFAMDRSWPAVQWLRNTGLAVCSSVHNYGKVGEEKLLSVFARLPFPYEPPCTVINILKKQNNYFILATQLCYWLFCMAEAYLQNQHNWDCKIKLGDQATDWYAQCMEVPEGS